MKKSILLITSCVLLALSSTSLCGQYSTQDFSFHIVKASDLSLPMIQGELPVGVVTWQSDRRGQLEVGIILEENTQVKISILDDNENLIDTLVSENLEPGSHPFYWKNKKNLNEIYIVYECDDYRRSHFIELQNKCNLLSKIWGWIF